MLAGVRQQGYSTEDGEVTPGFASVGAPVLDHTGHPVGAVGVTYEADRAPDRDTVVERVTATALALTRRLGGGTR
jgi:DNA-binding IclR family transcriptional regulator